MKPETERLLQQCRAVLLQYSNEQLNTLFISWFELMIGEEHMDETLDDLCLQLGYGIHSTYSDQVYFTYTAWWEVEGSADLEGEFVCLDVEALLQRLIAMPIKRFDLITELAYQVCTILAESQSGLPRGQEWLRALALWLNSGAQEPFHKQHRQQEAVHTPPPPPKPQQLSHKQRKAQQHQLESTLANQASQKGYLLLTPDVSSVVVALVRKKCRKNGRPYISAQPVESEFATLSFDISIIRKIFEIEKKLSPDTLRSTFLPTDTVQAHLMQLTEQYCVRTEITQQEIFALLPYEDTLELKQVLQPDIPKVIQDFMALWPEILTQYKAQLNTSYSAYQARQRELEEARKPAWMRTLTHLQVQKSIATYPELAENVTLPKEWANQLSKEQLGAFLTFLKLPASSREIKANLVQHLSTTLETNKIARAQFFEVFAFELSVPPWELETLLGCTTTERKRWTEEEKLPILDYASFHKAGNDHNYAVYDRRIILALTSEDIELWRNEHQAIVRERRKVAAREAAATRKAKRNEEQLAHTTIDA